MVHTGITEEHARACAMTFFLLTELTADGAAEEAADLLCDYLTDDDDTAHTNAWSLASVGPLLAAHAVRVLWKDRLRDDDLFVIEELAGAPSATVEVTAWPCSGRSCSTPTVPTNRASSTPPTS